MDGEPAPELAGAPARRYCTACGTECGADFRHCPACGHALDAPLAVPGGVRAGAFGRERYGGFWIRVGASLIDSGIVLIPLSVVWSVLGIVGSPLAFVAGATAWWLYSALLESSARQATVGKSAVGLRVTDGEGRRIGFGRATGRHFGKYLCVATFYIGFIMVGLTERRQGLHDLLAGTLVQRGSRPGAV